MTSLLTSIAGQFAKPLLLSALLPVVIVSSLFLLLLAPLFPLTLTLPAAITKLDASWQVAWGTLIALVAAMLLYVLNTPIARLFSGYPWMHVVPGIFLVRKWRTEFLRLRTARDGLATLWDSLDAAKPAELLLRTRLKNIWKPLAIRLNEEFPYDEGQIMPTKLGNVIRNFEEYSSKQYGISGVLLWPRLVAVLDARHAAVLDDAKTSFDFPLNCLFLCCAAATLTMTLALLYDARGTLLVEASVRAGVFVLLAILAYAAAVDRAQGWGAYVKAAVDLYRGVLMKQLGYQYTLVDIADERERVWSTVGSEWTYPDMSRLLATSTFAPLPVLPTPPTTVTSENKEPLVVTRGVSTPAGKPYAQLTVTLLVQHTGTAAPTKVTVTDVVPANWAFVWGSVAITSTAGTAPGAGTGAATVTVKGSTPAVVLLLDHVAVGATCTITYTLQSLIATP